MTNVASRIALSNNKMDLSIVIVSYNTKKITLDCLKSIVKHTKGVEYEIIVIDNASKDGSIDAVKQLRVANGGAEMQYAKRKAEKPKNLKVIVNKKNIGFGQANNQGMKKAKGRYILLLNSDTLLHDNVAGEMVDWMDQNPKIGISTCKLLNKDGSIQGTGGYFPTLIRVFSWMTIEDIPGVAKLIKPFHPLRTKSLFKGETFYKKERELDWATGAFMLLRSQVIKDVGFFDKDYFMYTEDVDYCFRAKKMGWQVRYQPKWAITHLAGASGKVGDYIVKEFEGVKTFYQKHMPTWQTPFVRLFLKIGAALRMAIFGLLKGKGAAKTYARAFKIA